MTKTIAQLKDELAKKENQLLELKKKRDSLRSELEQVERDINDLSGSKNVSRKTASTGRPGLRSNKRSLGDVLADALKGKGTVRVMDAAKHAAAAGYRSASKQFDNVVSQTLKMDARFRKVARGKYKLKSSAAQAGTTAKQQTPAKKSVAKKTSKKKTVKKKTKKKAAKKKTA